MDNITKLLETKNEYLKKIKDIDSRLSNNSLSSIEAINNLSAKESLITDLKVITFQLEGNQNLDLDKEITRIRAKIHSLKKIDSWDDSLEELEELINSPDFPSHWAQGLKFLVGKPTTIGAFSGVGKSTFLINIIYYYLTLGKRLLIFSNEMTKGEYLAKLIQFESFVKAGKGIKFFDVAKYRKEFNFLKDKWEKNFIVYQCDEMPASEIAAYAEILKNDIGIDFVFIDYVQNVPPEIDTISRPEKDQIKRTMNIFKTCSKRIKVPFIIAAQTNRSSKKDNVNDHSAFEGSGYIEKDSALCMLLQQDEENRNHIIANVSKFRFGKPGKIRFILDETTRYIIRGEKIE